MKAWRWLPFLLLLSWPAFAQREGRGEFEERHERERRPVPPKVQIRQARETARVVRREEARMAQISRQAERQAAAMARRTAPVAARPVFVPRPKPIANPAHIVRDQRMIEPPKTDEIGRPLAGVASQTPPNHTTIIRNPHLNDAITMRRPIEVRRNYYYWHNDYGVRYCHYYDNWGVHWYGFYVGPNYYWTRWWARRWWWYDPYWSRWVYWNDGYWWWQDPHNIAVVYVYDNGAYVPPDEVATAAAPAPAAAPPPSTPAPGAPGGAMTGDTVYSADGSRMVQVMGERKEGFLYDRSGGKEPQFLAFLARDVKQVQFSDASGGKPLQVLVFLNDGSFKVFDAQGQPYAPQGE